MPIAASRVAVPVYKGGRQVGKATSTTWSPVLKKLIALATIDRPHFADGTTLEVEITVEAVRHRARATVVPTPFYNPPQKTATPPGASAASIAARTDTGPPSCDEVEVQPSCDPCEPRPPAGDKIDP